MSNFDMIDVLYSEEDDQYESRLARASLILSTEIGEAGLAEFVGRSQTKEARVLRLDLVQSSVDNMVSELSDHFSVDAEDLLKVAEKHINPDTPIGGPEGKKYKNTTKVDPSPDATTSVDDTKAVLDKDPEELETVDLNKDTAKKASVTVTAASRDTDLDSFEPIEEPHSEPEGHSRWNEEDIALAKQAMSLQDTSMGNEAIELFLDKLAERIAGRGV